MSDYPYAVLPTRMRNYSAGKQEPFSDYGCLEAVDIEVASLSNPLVFAKKHHLGLEEDSSLFLESLPKSIDNRILEPCHDFLMLDKPEPITELLDDDRSLADCYPTRTIASLTKVTSVDTCIKIAYIATVLIEYIIPVGLFGFWLKMSIVSDMIPQARNLPEVLLGELENSAGWNISWLQTTPFLIHLNNLAEDHPDVTNNTFFHLLADVSRDCDTFSDGSSSDECVRNSPFEKAVGNCERRSYVRHFDPCLCDVNTQILQDFYLDELQYDGMTYHCDRDFTGGSLSYTCLATKNHKQCGVLICPQTQTLDELSFKLLSIDYNTELENEDNSYFGQRKKSPVIPSIRVGHDFRQTLNGRILQIDVVPEDETNVLCVGVRSDYYISMNRFCGDQTEWDDESNRLMFTSDNVVSTLGVIKTSKRTTSIANSPYIPGECIISTEDRYVRLWNADINKTVENQLDMEVLMTGTMGGLRSSDPWRDVCFAAHPRQINVADSESVCVFDTRTQDEYLALLNIATSRHSKSGEKIYCIESGRNFGNEYECLVATDSNLYLIDQRHSGEPLLQMGTYMTFPPQFICPCVIASAEVRESEFSPSQWRNTTMAVLLANQSAQELFCYQLCKTKQISNSGKEFVKAYSPQCVNPPRKLGSYYDVWRYLKVNPSKHSLYLNTRTSKKLIGVEAVDLKMKDGTVLAMQINSVGDIGYQTLSMMKLDDAYDMRQTLTEKTILTNEKEIIRRNLETVKIQNYSKWAEAVSAPVRVDGRKKVISKDVGLAFRHIAHHRECTVSRRFNTTVFSLEKMQEFVSSSCRLCAANVQLPCDKTDDSHATICSLCQLNLSKTNMLLKTLMANSTDKAATLNNNSLMRDAVVNDGDNQCRRRFRLGVGHDEFVGKGDEVSELLKGTWSDSYENYWEKQRKEKNEVDLENQRRHSILTYDLANNDTENTKNSLSLNVISSQGSQIPSILKKSSSSQKKTKELPKKTSKRKKNKTEKNHHNTTANCFSPRKGTPKRVQFSTSPVKRDSPRNIFSLPKPDFSFKTETESTSQVPLHSSQSVYNFFSPSRGRENHSPHSPNNSKELAKTETVDSFLKSKPQKKKHSHSLGF